MIVLGGTNSRQKMVEKYDINGKLVETLPSFINANINYSFSYIKITIYNI